MLREWGHETGCTPPSLPQPVPPQAALRPERLTGFQGKPSALHKRWRDEPRNNVGTRGLALPAAFMWRLHFLDIQLLFGYENKIIENKKKSFL